ncbi:MAG: phenylalanine 4-monooxygenase [Burkholderiales bacterium]|nr:phenylalanine 4-monooxygenase [Burkholderiales bacterium]
MGMNEHPLPDTAGLRGDYGAMAADWTVRQPANGYSAEEHDVWRTLLRRQSLLAQRHACPEFLDGLAALQIDERIPDFERASDVLRRRTGWRIVGVPGLIPDDAFYGHLAARRFPVTVWIRRRDEFDYLAEPDLFHDFFGHVPLLFDPVFADYLQAYGRGGLKADALGAIEMLARLYWYTVEFGLIETPEGVRAYGAGILSSGGELPYCVESAAPHRIGFDLLRIMRTRYKIDTFQETYFVIRDFRELFDATAPDFTPYYAELARQEVLAADALLPADRRFTPPAGSPR